jgi:hypothetical protein
MIYNNKPNSDNFARFTMNSTVIISLSIKNLNYVQKRSMWRVGSVARPNSTVFLRMGKIHTSENRNLYYSVHTPIPSSSSNTSLNTNPIVMLHRKNKTVCTQHSETICTECEINTCKTALCQNLCGTIKNRKIIGHITHSEDHANLRLANTDLEGTSTPQYLVLYDNPHNWEESKSHNPDLDKKKTKNLFAMLTEIKDGQNES